MDDDYRLISKEALMLLTKAAEMFVQDLAGTCGKFATQQKRKTLQVSDLMAVAEYSDKFHFIKDSKLPSLNLTKQ
jgi:histone H3/H4